MTLDRGSSESERSRVISFLYACVPAGAALPAHSRGASPTGGGTPENLPQNVAKCLKNNGKNCENPPLHHGNTCGMIYASERIHSTPQNSLYA